MSASSFVEGVPVDSRGITPTNINEIAVKYGVQPDYLVPLEETPHYRFAESRGASREAGPNKAPTMRTVSLPAACTPGGGGGPFGACGMLGIEASAYGGIGAGGGLGDKLPFWMDPGNPCYGLDPLRILGLLGPNPRDPEGETGRRDKRPIEESLTPEQRKALEAKIEELQKKVAQFLVKVKEALDLAAELEAKKQKKLKAGPPSDQSGAVKWFDDIEADSKAIKKLEGVASLWGMRVRKTQSTLKKLQSALKKGVWDSTKVLLTLTRWPKTPSPFTDAMSKCIDSLLGEMEQCMLGQGLPDSLGGGLTICHDAAPLDCAPDSLSCGSPMQCGCLGSGGAGTGSGLLDSDCPDACSPIAGVFTSAEAGVDCTVCNKPSARSKLSIVEICSSPNTPMGIFHGLGCGVVDPSPLANTGPKILMFPSSNSAIGGAAGGPAVPFTAPAEPTTT